MKGLKNVSWEKWMLLVVVFGTLFWLCWNNNRLLEMYRVELAKNATPGILSQPTGTWRWELAFLPDPEEYHWLCLHRRSPESPEMGCTIYFMREEGVVVIELFDQRDTENPGNNGLIRISNREVVFKKNDILMKSHLEALKELPPAVQNLLPTTWID
ncbi:hypothetical protein ACFL2B_01755 [Patescibacteria group bacterium]